MRDRTGVAPTNTPCVGQTVLRSARVTRAPFDLAFKAAVTQLNTALQSVTSASGWYVLTGAQCGTPFTGTTALAMQYYINCPAESSNFKLTQTWSFPPGAMVLVNGDLVLGSGGCFATNVDAAWNVLDLCTGVFVPPSTLSTTAIVQVRGNIDAQGGGSIILPNTYLGVVPRSGLAQPTINGTSFEVVLWTAPYYADKTAARAACDATATATFPAPECFRNLAYWTETTALNTIKGGAFLTLEGTFFLGEAPLTVGGNGRIFVTKSQFVAQTITNGGGKLLNFVPDPQRTTGVPTFGVVLIR